MESPDASKRAQGMMRPRFNQNLEGANNIELNAYGQGNFDAHRRMNTSIGAGRTSDAPPEGSIKAGIPSVPDMIDQDKTINDSYNGSLVTAKGARGGKNESNNDRESYLGK